MKVEDKLRKKKKSKRHVRKETTRKDRAECGGIAKRGWIRRMPLSFTSPKALVCQSHISEAGIVTRLTVCRHLLIQPVHLF